MASGIVHRGLRAKPRIEGLVLCEQHSCLVAGCVIAANGYNRVMSTNDYISVEEAAQLIGCGPRHVRWLCAEGRLRCRKLGRGTWLVELQSAEEVAATPEEHGRPRGASRKPSV